MEFAFTDDQLAFRDAVRELLAKECPPSVVRAAWTNADGRSGAAWKALGEMGVLGALVPEAGGGLGLTELDVVLLAEEAGRAALPEPFVEHVLVGAPLAAADYPDVVTGATTVTAGDPLIPWAASADVLIRLAPDPVMAGRTGAELASRDSVDGARRLAVLTGAAESRPLTRAELSEAFWRGNLGYSAQLLGLARQMLDITVAYVIERNQFGAPIGSFQAIKHHLADVRIGIEFAAPLVYRAAHSLATGDADAPLHVSMGKAQAADVAHHAARTALQCHGAIGYSFEYDLHLWMKRAWALTGAWGDAAWHRDRVARAILDTNPAEEQT
ncbi:MAG: acyl-CoA/acyl-ACP dehydrogenase [Acidimicrobiia bacterium]|nr:acyl-CoA/acyl-ACP dehydrogenase [Acidimicrobiia bacterium]